MTDFIGSCCLAEARLADAHVEVGKVENPPTSDLANAVYGDTDDAHKPMQTDPE